MDKHASPKVLLIQPPVYDFALYDLFLRPYGLLRIGSWFADSGYDVALLDCLDWNEPATVRSLGRVKRKPDGTGKFHMTSVPFPVISDGLRRRYHRYGILREVIKRRIAQSQADIVCVTTGMTYWYPGVVEVLDIIHDVLPRALIFIGGIYATLMPEHLGSLDADVHIVQGNAAETLSSVLNRAGFPVPVHPVPTFPHTCSSVWKHAAVLRLSEGCPLNCDYCASRVLSPKFLPGNPQAAAAWLADLHHLHGVRNVAFYDDALLVDTQRILVPFLQAVIKEKLPIRFYTPNGVHITHIDGATAALMKQAGFQELRMGFESSSDQFHSQHDRKCTKEAFHSAVAAAHASGFSLNQLRVYVLAGIPGQLKDEVEQSVRYAGEAGVRVSIAEYTPVPGTALWDESCRRSKFPLADEPLYHNNTLQPLSWSGLSRDDMQDLKQLASKAGS